MSDVAEHRHRPEQRCYKLRGEMVARTYSVAERRHRPELRCYAPAALGHARRRLVVAEHRHRPEQRYYVAGTPVADLTATPWGRPDVWEVSAPTFTSMVVRR